MRGGDVPPVVCFAGQDWEIHGRAHCDFQIMRELGALRTVLVVNSIGMRMPLPGTTERPLARVMRKLRSTLRYYVRRPLASSPGLVVLTPVSLPVFGRPVLRRVNAWGVAVQVWVAARALRLRDPWVLLTVPTAIDVVERLGWADRLVYYRADDHAAQPDVDRGLIRAFEERIMASARAVLYASRALMEREHARTGPKARFVDHGVELDHFRPIPEHVDPPDLAAIPRPRIGFFGQIDSTSVDLELVERLGREVRDVASIVMIGRVAADVSALERAPNVHLLGFRPYEILPQYARGFDVAIVAFPTSDWINAVNPIKLKEYLALGLPVVATATPDLRRFGDTVDLAVSSDEFVALVRQRLADPRPEDGGRRRESVAEAGWDRRAAAIVELMVDA